MSAITKTLAAALATGIAMGASTGAQAALTPITSQPVASGEMTVVFVAAFADDDGTLSWSQGGPDQVLIVNNPPAVRSAVGTTISFGAAGVVSFVLDNATQGYSFTAGIADPVDGLQHARSTTNFADFGVGAISAAAQAAITATGKSGIFIGFEDRRNGDYDYNDLIYWFASVRLVDAPAPAALGLFGLGLLGLGLMRRKG